MNSARAGIVLGLTVLGGLLAGLAQADDVAWKPATQAMTPTLQAVPPRSQPVQGLIFTPVSNPTFPAAMPSPFGSATSTQTAPVRTATPARTAEPGLTWVPVPMPATPIQAPLPAPLPAPRPLIPDAFPPVPDNPTQPIPPAKLTAPEAVPAPAAGWSNEIWGTRTAANVIAESAPDGVIVEAPVNTRSKPVRYHGVSSPNVVLSRDHHFLDIFGVPLIGDDGNSVILGEGAPVTNSYVSMEYLLWWQQPGTIPVLASTATNGGFGFLNNPGSTAILGPGRFGPSLMDGMRIRAGTWFHGGGTGLDASFFFLGRRSAGFAVGSDTTPIITRPFFAPNPGVNREFGEQVAFPGQSTGSLAVNNDAAFWGMDINLLNCVCRTCDSRSNWFLGFRHLNMQEGLGITETLTAGPMASQPVGTSIIVHDSFQTRNRFYGAQLGWGVGRTRGRFDIDGRVSVALGGTHQELEISGYQAVTPPGGQTQTFTGGLLAAGPNLGSFSRDRFSVVPEFTLNFGYMFSPNFRTHIGYNVIYWSDVMRPGEQIDRTVDLTYVPNGPAVPFSGQARPQPQFRSSDMWLQGIQFGAEFRW